MKSLFEIARYSAAIAALTSAVQTVHAQQLVYANTNAFTAHFATGSLEVGNEITLAGSGRQLTSFAFEYYLPTASGSETAQVRFYKNDSAPFAGYNSPGTILYDSGVFNIGSFGSQSSATLNFTLADLTTGVPVPLTGAVPDSFTWTIQFGGLGAGEDIGVDLYHPISVGSAPSDMWQNNAGSWQLAVNSTYALTIGAEMTATPEPSSLALLSVAGLGLIGMAIKRRRAVA